jgi:exonuclease SbcC
LRVSEIEADLDRLTGEVNRQTERIDTIEHEINAIKARAIEITTLSTRLENGRSKIAEQEGVLIQAREVVNQTAAELSRTAPVTEAEINEQRDLVARERDIEQLRAKLDQVRETVVGQISRVADLGAQIAEIGEVSFDANALKQARTMLDEARAAQTRLVSIDQQLGRRTEYEGTISDATGKLEVATAEVSRLEAEIAAHPIDELALDRAELEVDRARQKEQQVRSQQETLRRERLKVEQALNQIDADQKRLAGVAERAEKARVDADDLDRMYKEFNTFEQYVARRVRPQLEDMTSELVRVITENKYESITLDDDYGVKVWDGELGPYPIEHFSGGERDVIALSARLALSRLIGSQAANPPSFLVLDEVFGSLDQDRRANVLTMLSSLAGSAESFQQLFVISHVDDVRLSPAFNEIWRVAELEDGSSRLENLNLTQGVEDL